MAHSWMVDVLLGGIAAKHKRHPKIVPELLAFVGFCSLLLLVR